MTFAEVYDQHFEFVWRSLRRLGVPERDASDAAQEVFLVVHRKLDEFEERSKITTWLFGICLRVASNLRRLQRSRAHDDDGHIAEAPDHRADVGAEAERRQELALLESILDEMPLEQRAVFTMFELDAMTGTEIAGLLGIPIGTVYSRLRAAREAFQEILGRRKARDRFRATTIAVHGARPSIRTSGWQ